jgi:hypothetical protein
MKTFSLRQLLLLLTATLMTGAIPAQAARYSHIRQLAVFQITNTTRIAVGTDRSAELADVSVGDRVSIAYDHENGTLVAYHIADGVPHKPHVVRRSIVLHPRHPATTSPYLHIGGFVRAIDPASGTLTIAY